MVHFSKMSNIIILPNDWILYKVDFLQQSSSILDAVSQWVLKIVASDETLNLTNEEVLQSYTICSCSIDINSAEISEVITNKSEDSTLRTYALLYALLDKCVYVFGLCPSFSLLSAQLHKRSLKTSDFLSPRQFLTRLSEQKGKALTTHSKLFGNSFDIDLTQLSFCYYQRFLNEILDYVELQISPEYVSGLSSLPWWANNVLFTYACFAVSPFDDLIEKLVAFEKQQFHLHYNEFIDIPWLRFEFVKRYLGVDWSDVVTNYYSEVTDSPVDTNAPTYDSAAYAYTHCSTEHAFSDFYFLCEARYSPVQSPFHCKEHNNTCGTSLSLKNGRHIVPYGKLEYSALRLLEVLVRRKCLDFRRVFSTREAPKTWNESVSRQNFVLLRTSEENSTSETARPMIEKWAGQWYDQLHSYKNCELIQFTYDAKLKETILGFWDSILAKRYSQRLDLAYEKRISASTFYDNRKFESETIPNSYEELVEFAHHNWSPCMIRLVEKCNGSHLVWSERLAVIRFLLSTKTNLSEVQAATVWELFWVKSDVYQGQLSFWDSEHGLTFKDLVKRKLNLNLDNWPSCKKMMDLNCCPFVNQALPTDIEDSAQLIPKRRARCLGSLKDSLEARGLMMTLQSPNIWGPNSYPFLMRYTVKITQ